jgi:hypothetical protein
LVRLVGRERDLRFLASGVREPWRITEEGDEFYLRSSGFEGLNEAGEVKRLADEFLDWANLHSLLRFEGYQGVHTGEIVSLNPDGSRHVTIAMAVGHVKAGATVSGVGVSIGSPIRAQPPDLTGDMSLLKQRPRLVEALRYVREEPGWFGYWKGIEALGEDIGGQDKIVWHGWATKGEWDRFYHTVHYHRHHRKPAPPSPMSEHEAKSFLLGLLRSCVDWRLSKRR